MSIPKSIGFPCMQEEPGEKRAFLPKFVRWLAEKNVDIVLEEGYGDKLGLSLLDYQQSGLNIISSSRKEAFQQDVVMILRSPQLDEFTLLKRDAILISMLHYHTRPQRVARLQELGIRSISLDSIADASGTRLVENMKSVAWNGLEAAFDILESRFDGPLKDQGKPFNVVILGTGMVGQHALDAATKLGSRARNDAHILAGGSGVIAVGVGRNLTQQADEMEKLLRQADVLVDTTLRSDPSKPIVPNVWLAWLPEHAVIVDLAVDPYILDVNPPVVRGIEGIPQGNLDQYIFHPDDPNWNQKIPKSVPSDVRRTSISCYSWPGIHPKACMRHYELQLKPLLEVLLEVGYEGLSSAQYYFAKALYHGSLDYFLNQSE